MEKFGGFLCKTGNVPPVFPNGRKRPRGRRKRIKELLSEKPFVSLSELEAMFPDVTSMTLRRDINLLEEKGELIKVRGGAKSMKFIKTSMEDEYGKRLFENPEGKSKIADKAAEMIADSRSVFVDSGTTALRLAAAIPDMQITVTTTSPHVALELVKKGRIMVNIVGGIINHDNLSVSGMQALRFIDDINIDLAFIVPSGCSSAAGFTCGNYSECELKRHIVGKARRVILLMDRDKLDRCLPYTFCTPGDVHTIITDGPLPEEYRAYLSSGGAVITEIQ